MYGCLAINIILVVFLVPGLVYGSLSKEIKNTKDLGKMFGRCED
ncbi:AbgT family transporter [Staphylococcus aureus]